jgi:hypothetical protein
MTTFNTREYGGNGGEPHIIKCNDGHYIKEIYGRSNASSGPRLNKIGAICTDNQNIGSHGGNDGTEFSYINDDGFRIAEVVLNEDHANHVKFYTKTPAGSIVKHFERGSSNNHPFEMLECYNKGPLEDGRIVGFNLKSGSHIDSLGLICGHTFLTHCNKAPITDTKCLNFCKVNSGKCDDLMTRYCNEDSNKNSPECSCLNSPAINYNPICVDGKCIKDGYATQGMINQKPCPDIVDCRIYNSIAETGRNVEFDAKIEQKCGQAPLPTAGVPQIIPGPGSSQTIANSSDKSDPSAANSSEKSDPSAANSSEKSDPSSPTDSGLSLLAKIIIIAAIIFVVIIILYFVVKSKTSGVVNGVNGVNGVTVGV